MSTFNFEVKINCKNTKQIIIITQKRYIPSITKDMKAIKISRKSADTSR